MSQLESYITRYGAVAGPKLYHAIRSRSAYMGANARRRAAIARLTRARSPRRVGRPPASARAEQEPGSSPSTPTATDPSLSDLSLRRCRRRPAPAGRKTSPGWRPLP